MDVQLIMNFLRQVMVNNNRPWFTAHKGEYLEAKASFEQGVQDALRTISAFDPTVAHLKVSDVTYRFYRDTRFSTDKSPYKHHFGAYMAAHGKKALHGGYYLHLEPDNCMLACGNYFLPTNILTSCRNEIMGRTDEWLRCVDSPAFKRYFGDGGEGSFEDNKGFGLAKLKTTPSGFPRDYEYVRYLRLKDYCCWHRVPDSFFQKEDWLKQMAKIYQTAKPMMDFVNEVVDDYE